MWELSETKKKRGIGSHHSARSGTDEWFTPREIIWALGPFDLDPCTSARRPWATAKAHWTRAENGLTKPWSGRVWCNPPYGVQTRKWLRLLADHGNGIALVFARTDTQTWFKYVWKRADGILFIDGRLNFCYPDGRRCAKNSGGPSALVAYGIGNVEALRRCAIRGALVVRGESEYRFELK